jgi:hypothetical protein
LLLHRFTLDLGDIPDERPSKPVQVLIDEVWRDGTLEAWRRTDGRWRGYVRWSVGVGMRHLGWVDQEQLRPVKTR